MKRFNLMLCLISIFLFSSGCKNFNLQEKGFYTLIHSNDGISLLKIDKDLNILKTSITNVSNAKVWAYGLETNQNEIWLSLRGEKTNEVRVVSEMGNSKISLPISPVKFINDDKYMYILSMNNVVTADKKEISPIISKVNVETKQISEIKIPNIGYTGKGSMVQDGKYLYVLGYENNGGRFHLVKIDKYSEKITDQKTYETKSSYVEDIYISNGYIYFLTGTHYKVKPSGKIYEDLYMVNTQNLERKIIDSLEMPLYSIGFDRNKMVFAKLAEKKEENQIKIYDLKNHVFEKMIHVPIEPKSCVFINNELLLITDFYFGVYSLHLKNNELKLLSEGNLPTEITKNE